MVLKGTHIIARLVDQGWPLMIIRILLVNLTNIKFVDPIIDENGSFKSLPIDIQQHI